MTTILSQIHFRLETIYQVTTSYLCAAYVVKDGRVVACAPILRKRLAYWMTVAVRVQPPPCPS